MTGGRIAQQVTAADAFTLHVQSGKAQAQQARIVAFIEQRGGSWSIGELADAMRLQKSTLSARLNELITIGRVIPAERRKDRVSGVMVRPVRLPPGQADLFQ